MRVLPIRLLLLMMMTTSAWADTMYPVISYICDSNADVIKVKNEVKWNEEGEAVQYSDTEESGVYNPWNWVNIENRPPRKLVSETKQIEKSCQLSSGIYKVILQPYIFNVNALAKCGDQISARVTVLRGGTILIDKKPLQEFCHGNAPIIRGIKVMGDSGEVKIYEVPRHKFY